MDARGLDLFGSQGKAVTAVIEYVRDGCTLRAFLLPSMQNVMICLTGIKTPTFKRSDDGSEQAEPFAAEAKFFIESRLLQREVMVVIEGTAGANLLGSIQHPRGNISEFLIKEGYARIVDWSFGQISSGRDQLRASEKAAKEKGIRIWRDWQPSNAGIPEGDRTFSAVVVEIVNPERFYVVMADGTRKELALSSVRQPRRDRSSEPPAGDVEATADGEAPRRARPLFDTPFMLEAREFLRKKLIGETVTCYIDYVKPAEGRYPEKTCVTCTHGNVNIGEALIRKGLSTALRHRNDDDSRSSKYDDLLSAEVEASGANRGLHIVNTGAKPSGAKVQEIQSKQTADRCVINIAGSLSPPLHASERREPSLSRWRWHCCHVTSNPLIGTFPIPLPLRVLFAYTT